MLKWEDNIKTNLAQDWVLVLGSCKHGNESLGSIKGGVCLGRFSDCQRLENSAPLT
jgi:hypothetical protein